MQAAHMYTCMPLAAHFRPCCLQSPMRVHCRLAMPACTAHRANARKTACPPALPMQQNVRKLPMIRNFKLSKYQASMNSVKRECPL